MRCKVCDCKPFSYTKLLCANISQPITPTFWTLSIGIWYRITSFTHLGVPLTYLYSWPVNYMLATLSEDYAHQISTLVHLLDNHPLRTAVIPTIGEKTHAYSSLTNIFFSISSSLYFHSTSSNSWLTFPTLLTDKWFQFENSYNVLSDVYNK